MKPDVFRGIEHALRHDGGIIFKMPCQQGKRLLLRGKELLSLSAYGKIVEAHRPFCPSPVTLACAERNSIDIGAASFNTQQFRYIVFIQARMYKKIVSGKDDMFRVVCRQILPALGNVAVKSSGVFVNGNDMGGSALIKRNYMEQTRKTIPVQPVKPGNIRVIPMVVYDCQNGSAHRASGSLRPASRRLLLLFRSRHTHPALCAVIPQTVTESAGFFHIPGRGRSRQINIAGRNFDVEMK